MANIEVTHESISVEIETAGIQGGEGPPGGFDDIVITTGAPGTDATANISGTKPNQTLELTIPKGDPGGFVNAADLGSPPQDANLVTNAGNYFHGGTSGTTALNYPENGWGGFLEVIKYTGGGDWFVQRATSYRTDIDAANGKRIWHRSKTGSGSWGPWIRSDITGHEAATNPHPQYSQVSKMGVVVRNLIKAPYRVATFWTPNTIGTSINNWGGLSAPFNSVGIQVNADGTTAYQGLSAQNKVPVVAGRTYTLSAYINSPNTGMNVRIGFANSSLNPAVNGIAVPADQWKRISVTATASTTGNLAFVYIDTGVTPQNKTFYVTDIQLEEGGLATDIVKGDYNGSLWTGATEDSESIKLSLNASEYRRLAYNGSGSPEGVVTAPVGTRYIDNDVTNGALEWIKFSGTSSTGWKPVYADTGWRNVTSMLTAPAVAWTSHNIAVRRVNETVSWVMGYTWQGDPGWRQVIPSLGTGWMPGTNAFGGSGAKQISMPANNPEMVLFSDGSMNAFRPTSGNVQVMFNYVTDNPWPTSLPGTAL